MIVHQLCGDGLLANSKLVRSTLDSIIREVPAEKFFQRVNWA